MPDEASLDLSRQWLEQSAEDLAAARRLADLPSLSAFHSQQSVEKASKALLVLRGIAFSKTHDIDILLRQLAELGLSPGHMDTADLAALTRFAVDTRYPPESASSEEAADALSVVELFYRWAKATFPTGT